MTLATGLVRAVRAAAIVALTAGFAAAPARAQFGGGRDMAPSVSSRDLDRYTEILALDADQQEVVRALFEGYQEQFRTRAQEMQEKMEAARAAAEGDEERGGPERWRAMGEQFEAFRKSRTEMEEQFFADVRAVLTPEQEAAWPKVERTHRRERTLGMGLMSGERVNLFEIVEQAELPPETRAAVAPLLDQYEVDLDRELVQRNKTFEEGMTEFRENMRNGRGMEGAQGAMDRARDASIRVREVNRRYARQIAALLPEDRKPAFERAVKEASFPDIYRRTGATRRLEAAAGFADLDEAQKQSLEGLRASYARDLEAINRKLEEATTEMEMTMTVGQMMRGGGRGGRGGDRDEGPMGELRRERRDLERATAESLSKILTPEQQERLPEDDRGRGRDGDEGERRRQEDPRRRA